MTNKKLKGFESNLLIEKLSLRNMDIPKFNTEDMINTLSQEIYDSAFNQWVHTISEEYPDTPITVIEAFVKCYFDFEIDNEYDIKTKCYTLKVTPIWKSVDLVNTESEEFKLLSNYAFIEEKKEIRQ